MIVAQDADKIFYEAIRDISVGEELLVWYGSSYDLYMGIPTGIKTSEERCYGPKSEGMFLEFL